MTDPSRPQPVIREFDIQGTISGLVVAIGSIAFIVRAGITTGNLLTLGNLVGTAVSLACGAALWFAARIHGKVAAAQVTPLESPQDYTGQPLLTADQWAARWGKHARPVEAPVEHQGADETWPDDIRAANPPTKPTPYRCEDAPVTDWQETPADRYTPTPRPLGRIVHHDPRSLQYLVPETDTPTSARWDRKTPVLDQGNLGSCTGNATVGVLGSEPFYDTLPATVQGQLDESKAVSIYSLATELDGYSGTYPPNDTGSSGLAAAKAAKQLGLISGYLHITSLAAAHAAIAAGPFITGVNWYEGFDNPDANGVVKISGNVRGGHEFEVIGYDAAKGMWEAVNSWGPSYGVGGHFYFSDATFTRLLSEQGDATTFVPITQPAPQPTPTPTPTPTPDPRIPADMVAWAKHVLTLKGQTHATIAVAHEILGLAGQ